MRSLLLTILVLSSLGVSQSHGKDEHNQKERGISLPQTNLMNEATSPMKLETEDDYSEVSLESIKNLLTQKSDDLVDNLIINKKKESILYSFINSLMVRFNDPFGFRFLLQEIDFTGTFK